MSNLPDTVTLAMNLWQANQMQALLFAQAEFHDREAARLERTRLVYVRQRHVEAAQSARELIALLVAARSETMAGAS